MTSPEFTFFRSAARLRAAASTLACALTTAAVLSACGGGGGAPLPPRSATPPDANATTPDTPDPIPTQDVASLNNVCAHPRTGTDPDGNAYNDRQGTTLDEMKFLRAWADKYYLWYNEVPSTVHMANYTNPIDYFAALRTPALTASGEPKDRFHFTYDTNVWNATTNNGVDIGYGVTWSRNASGTVPRNWRVAIVEPGSPAAVAGLVRGDQLVTVDDIDFVNTADKAGVAKINAGLFPDKAGEFHHLKLRRADTDLVVDMVSSAVQSDPVKNAKVIDTPTGKVGYLTFNDHNAVAEGRLIQTFGTFKSAGVSDLVLDMRYNGGGILYVASELAYMIGGSNVAGKTFENLVYNDKTAPQPPIPFLANAYGFAAPDPAPRGLPLPTLGLKRVTILTSADTCSASEAVINGLRGADVEVNLIGGQTCGKPYGFTPVDNCGTTYFSIEFRGTNAKGFGDFADGFTPTCARYDDLAHPLGDTSEDLLATALGYRASGLCTASPGSRAKMEARSIVRPAVRGMAIMPRGERIR